MKRETVAEFLARGGKITKVPTHQNIIKIDSVKSNTKGGPITIMTMDDADLYYGEQKQKKAKKKSSSTSVIDISALPEALRKKYIDGVIDAKRQEEDE